MNKHIPYSNLNFYQNANADAEEVKEGFLVRLLEYDIITSDILRNPMEGSVQHYLLWGKRGSGKSTLLKRLQVEIDEKYDDRYVAINTAEEQANVYKLSDLLHQILQEMEERYITVEWPGEEDDEHMYNRKLFSVLHQSLERAGKKVILLLDNIDRIFDNLGDDTSLLREYLSNFKDIKIIGASTRITEHFWSYKKPFYEFFQILELEPLSSEETRKLLLSWSEKMDLPQLRKFVETRSGQLETIRMLTDGLPRTLQFFVYILIRNERETGYEYLRLIMDNLTPLYQERLNNLPPAQRKIVLQLAFHWEAAGAKDLAQATRMESRLISAQLNQLVDKKVVEKIETKTKNHLYRLSERFFNLWLISTQGSQREKRRLEYLTVFLENFYEGKELSALEEAEKYFYMHNRDRSKVVSKLESAIATKQDRVLTLIPVVKAWNGDFKGMEADVLQLIREKRPGLDFMLLHLLIHYQVNVVQRIFVSPESGSYLVDRFLPLYYATRLLMPEATAYSIKIPPELREIVNDLLVSIYQKRDFYYNTKEAETFLRQNSELTVKGSVATDAT